MVLAITGAVVVLYGLQINVTGKDYTQSSPVPAIAAERKIVVYNRNNSDPVSLNLTETRLFFGLSRIENGSIKKILPAEWDSFLETSVRPVFESFTVIDAMGDYRGQREGTKILIILHNGGEDEEKIMALAQQYIERFVQEGVLRIDG